MRGRVYSRREIADLVSFDGNRRRPAPDWGNGLANGWSEMKPARRAIDVKNRDPARTRAPGLRLGRSLQSHRVHRLGTPGCSTHGKINNQPHPTAGELHCAQRPAPPCRQGGVDGVTPHGVGDSRLSSGRKSGRARGNVQKNPASISDRDAGRAVPRES